MNDEHPVRKQRSRRAKVLEFLFWALVAFATAVIMISMSERLLPANF